jgi:hypothetical protein
MLFLIVQQVERLFLLPETLHLEIPSFSLLLKTLFIGMRADLIVATIGLLLAVLLAGLVAPVARLIASGFGNPLKFGEIFDLAMVACCFLVSLSLSMLLLADMGYYHYNRQHLDLVFLEYLYDTVSGVLGSGLPSFQALQQTSAEVEQGRKWGARVVAFLLTETGAIFVWWLCWRRLIQPFLNSWITLRPSPLQFNSLLLVGLVAGAAGFSPKGPYAIRIANVSSAAYYTLAQNPILYATEALRAAIDSRLKEDKPLEGLMAWDNWVPTAMGSGIQSAAHTATVAADPGAMSLDVAVREVQAFLDKGGKFPYAEYPLVRETETGLATSAGDRKNVLLIFVEALDRRYLGKTVNGIAVTPFLDRLKQDSVYFEHFFANGTQTPRGLLASFCSYYPRRGFPAMKVFYTHDYLCFPSLLRDAGYHTEMVIGFPRDIDRLQLFMMRNGFQQVLDETDFADGGTRMGSGPSLGRPDGALFNFLRKRIEMLHGSGQPYLVATETLTTHHPFAVPDEDPEVHTLLHSQPDGYVAALRYLDLEFERFFTRLHQDGLLKHTIVFILGDHGRHEAHGQSDLERQIGHFLSPLFVWMDESIRTQSTYRPHVVSTVASQVDLGPTILAMNGLVPRLWPFLGRDISCLLIRDCLADNAAYLSSVYGDELIGLADRDGLLLYSLRSARLTQTDLALERSVVPDLSALDIAAKYRRLQALYITSNALLKQNRIWSWKYFGDRL